MAAATAAAPPSGSSTTTAFWRRSGRRRVDTAGTRARRLSGVPSNATRRRLASRGVMSWPVGVGVACGDALAMLRPVYGPVSSQAKSLVAAQPVETLAEAGAGTGGRGGPRGLPRFSKSRRCGLPRALFFRTRSRELVAGDVDFPKSTHGASRRRRRRGDAWGVVLGHFSRRLTSHRPRTVLPTSSIKSIYLWILAHPRVDTAAERYGTHR